MGSANYSDEQQISQLFLYDLRTLGKRNYPLYKIAGPHSKQQDELRIPLRYLDKGSSNLVMLQIRIGSLVCT
jgi:hypothetical protein